MVAKIFTKKPAYAGYILIINWFLVLILIVSLYPYERYKF